MPVDIERQHRSRSYFNRFSLRGMPSYNVQVSRLSPRSCGRYSLATRTLRTAHLLILLDRNTLCGCKEATGCDVTTIELLSSCPVS